MQAIRSGDVLQAAAKRPFSCDTKARWNTADFIRHYFFGRGQTVDLAAVGLLDAFRNHPSVASAVSRFKVRLLVDAEKRAQRHCRQSTRPISQGYSVTDRQSTNVRNDILGLYSVGGSLLGFRAQCALDIKRETQLFRLNARVDVNLDDAFVDAIDITNTHPGNQDVSGGHPYAIRAHWIETVIRTERF